jgi:hypothetical protein
VTEKAKTVGAIAVLLFGVTMIVRGLVLRGHTALGETCTVGSDECVDGATCMGFGARGGMCTKVCTHGGCPTGMRCEAVQVAVSGAAGVAMKRDYQATYCVK